jgi:hypothetical protein
MVPKESRSRYGAAVSKKAFFLTGFFELEALEVSIVMGDPQNGLVYFMENPKIKWMI